MPLYLDSNNRPHSNDVDDDDFVAAETTQAGSAERAASRPSSSPSAAVSNGSIPTKMSSFPVVFGDWGWKVWWCWVGEQEVSRVEESGSKKPLSQLRARTNSCSTPSRYIYLFKCQKKIFNHIFIHIKLAKILMCSLQLGRPACMHLKKNSNPL